MNASLSCDDVFVIVLGIVPIISDFSLSLILLLKAFN